jgi:Domain of unknown function (DUF4159)
MCRYSRQPLAIFLGVLSIIGISAAPGWAQSEKASTDQIQAAIEKAKVCLIKQQRADGSWDDPATMLDAKGGPTHTWGGYTALATYSLLASGYDPQSDQIKHAVAWLEKCQMKSVYCIGVRMQVWLLMYENADINDKNSRSHFEGLAEKDADFLIKNLNTTGPFAGLWAYFGKADRIDHSVSQYGVLGLWAAAQMGGEIPQKTWLLLDKAWRDGQYEDGGWSYGSAPNNEGNEVGWRAVHAAMTAAGIASLFITQEYANPTAGLACEGDIANDNIDNGLRWMTKNFDSANDMYTFYGIERIGVASGYKYFGKTDWFARISTSLVHSQGADGNWPYGVGGVGPSVGTSFGILFLARGGAPVMMNKLDYSDAQGHKGVEANWNERPRDAFNLARWTGVEAEADNLNWQVVNLQVSVDDLHDAPILYMAGNKIIKLAPADEDKLKQFVEEGGMIVGNADCGSEAFARSFEKLGEKLFHKYEFKDLGRDDLIYTGETYRKMRGHQTIRVLDNGVRKIMALFPTGDPARYWQQNATLTHTDAFQIGSDVFQYATDIKGLRKKGDTYIVKDESNTPSKKIAVARLMVGENPDPEPGGWRRLSAILHNAPFDLGVTVTPVQPGDVLAGNYQVVHLTGTTAFKLDAAEQGIIKDFVNKGGTLIIDAAGGSGVFADSAESALNEMFPVEAAKGLARPLELENPIYNVPNATITKVDYRRFAERNLLGSPKAPHIRGIEINKRLAIFYSREDLSAGMVGEQVDGIYGYDPVTATALMRNLVLYASK